DRESIREIDRKVQQTLPRKQPAQRERRSQPEDEGAGRSSAAAQEQIARDRGGRQAGDEQEVGLYQNPKGSQQGEACRAQSQAPAGSGEAEQPPAEQPGINQEVGPRIDVRRHVNENTHEQDSPSDPQLPRSQAN